VLVESKVFKEDDEVFKEDDDERTLEGRSLSRQGRAPVFVQTIDYL
jgi:hypothetical protein